MIFGRESEKAYNSKRNTAFGGLILSTDQIKMYGTKWCPDCARARIILDKNKVAFAWYDIEKDEEACSYVQKVNHGFKSVPTLVFPDGTIMVEPDNAQLEHKLKS
jgi:mycoredoxin